MYRFFYSIKDGVGKIPLSVKNNFFQKHVKNLRWLTFMVARPCRRCTRLLKKLLLGLLLLFSPFIAWVLLAVNRELIHYFVNARWLGIYFPDAFSTIRDDVNSRWFVSGFNEAALGGLLTLYGVIITVWFYHITRQQEVVEKRLFIIEEILEELKKNRKIIDSLGQSEQFSFLSISYGEEVGEELSPVKGVGTKSGNHVPKLRFYTKSWDKLGADVALLPRRIHMRLSVLYGCFAECTCHEDYYARRAVINRIPDVITELYRYRSKLSRVDLR